MQWNDARVVAPNVNDVLLVLDYWNIDEAEASNENSEVSEDSKQQFCSLRIAHFTGEDGDDNGKNVRWRESSRFQRVKFDWYVVQCWAE